MLKLNAMQQATWRRPDASLDTNSTQGVEAMPKKDIRPDSRFCSIDGCENIHDSQGYCSSHAHRLRRYGDPLGKPEPIVREKLNVGICKIDGCDSSVKRHGALCYAHYMRKYRTGNPLSDAEKKVIFFNRLISTPTNDCVIWPFAVKDNGYGMDKYEGLQITAHRKALILLTGINPADKLAAHGPCHNRRCVNPHPEHGMHWGTKKSNALDQYRDGTHVSGERNYQANLTDQEAVYAHQLRGKGMSTKEIRAVLPHASEANLQAIFARRSYKHLDLEYLGKWKHKAA